MHKIEALERLVEKGDTHAMTELRIQSYDTGDFERAIELLEAVTLCDGLNARALCTLGMSYAEYKGKDKEITDKVIRVWIQASQLGNKEACLCLGKVYHNGYEGKLKIEPDFESSEHWYTEALRFGQKIALLYLGKLYNDKSPQTEDEAVIAYTYYNAFYVLTSQDKDVFKSLRDEAAREMESIEKSVDENNGRGKIMRAFRKSNSTLLERLSSRLKIT